MSRRSDGNTSISPENIAGQNLSVGFRPLPQTTPMGAPAATRPHTRRPPARRYEPALRSMVTPVGREVSTQRRDAAPAPRSRRRARMQPSGLCPCPVPHPIGYRRLQGVKNRLRLPSSPVRCSPCRLRSATASGRLLDPSPQPEKQSGIDEGRLFVVTFIF
jgi:hypothetical protein